MLCCFYLQFSYETLDLARLSEKRLFALLTFCVKYGSREAAAEVWEWIEARINSKEVLETWGEKEWEELVLAAKGWRKEHLEGVVQVLTNFWRCYWQEQEDEAGNETGSERNGNG